MLNIRFSLFEPYTSSMSDRILENRQSHPGVIASLLTKSLQKSDRT
ncbi:hypothetical protein [Tolypothrix sp. PCC 7601]|nr:hypothetical protein [Tolypothrix sp. PCC 7601]UYD38559.1 hypothetical protein HG267_39420 [Tolypothrix sp. PCC 7601]